MCAILVDSRGSETMVKFARKLTLLLVIASCFLVVEATAVLCNLHSGYIVQIIIGDRYRSKRFCRSYEKVC